MYKPAKVSEAKEQQQQLSKNPVDDLVLMIRKFESQISMALPKHIHPSRMTRMIISEVRKTPQLAMCDRASFFGAMLTCARLGLEPGGGLGHIYLIPRKNKRLNCMEVQLIIGYQGMVDLVERDGRFNIDASAVFEKDQFTFRKGLNPSLDHYPYGGEDDPGKTIAAYAIARYSDGRQKFRVLTRYEIEKARAASDNSDGKFSPWTNFYGEMAMKTAIRRLFKVLPKNPEDPKMLEVLKLEDASDRMVSQNLKDDCPDEIKNILASKETESESSVKVDKEEEGSS